MELSAIESFCAVSRTGSLSKAAADLNVEQSTLTRQIDRLEKSVGVKLFHRSGRGMVLNEKGEIFYKYAEEVMAATTRARRAAAELAVDGPARIIIAAQPNIAQLSFSAIGHALKVEFPKSKLRFADGLGHQIMTWLQDGDIDAAILYLPERSTLIDYEVLLEEPLYLVSPYSTNRRHSISVGDLLDLPLVLPSTAYGLRALVNRLEKKTGKGIKMAIECDGSAFLTKRLVQSHHGHSIMPLAAVIDEIQQKTLSSTLIDDPDTIRKVVLATAKGRPAISGLPQITHVLKQTIARLVEKKEWPGVKKMS
jgi:DNA-binding transcriptional LysR family regulator